MMEQSLRVDVASTIRMLAADAVETANSGHPGAPMGQADLAFVLWDEFLRFDPQDPEWVGRDRFVLSCGHASMLQYALLHLYGCGLEIDDLKAFRQWGSLTPGHPEVGHTKGVEVTTGPLGQGIANSVGMALAAKMSEARFETGDDFNPGSKQIFAICSDGDLMEGISAEAASLAGHWRLSNLVWLYDDNGITIDGSTDLAFSENIALRFESMGWRVLKIDGHDTDAIANALTLAREETVYPTLIICKTHIGYGSPNKVDTAASHGAPLGADELTQTRNQLNWSYAPFEVPAHVRQALTASQARKHQQAEEWREQFAAWSARHPELREAFDALNHAEVPQELTQALLDAVPEAGATRKLSATAISEAAKYLPTLVGGSADLTGSNGALIKSAGVVGHPDYEGQSFSFEGRQLYFGIREHAMGAITNGMLLHGGFRPFGATFLVFSDYCRATIRMAALCNLPNIFVFTHDSIFLGEDGPTHQPVEHHWALRMIPNLAYFRPADGVEVAMGWRYALEQNARPVAFGLTRQNLPALDRTLTTPEDVLRGGYVLSSDVDSRLTLIATGSEVHVAVEAAQKLRDRGHAVRVVSMPCVDVFLEQDNVYQQSVLGDGVRVSIEAGVTLPWAKFTGLDGLNIGIDTFGASAPASVLAEQFGLTTDAVTAKILRHID
ncbi:MAG: transketolase [Bradymonadia bacterium]